MINYSFVRLYGKDIDYVVMVIVIITTPPTSLRCRQIILNHDKLLTTQLKGLIS